jgi:hypothetical protein
MNSRLQLVLTTAKQVCLVLLVSQSLKQAHPRSPLAVLRLHTDMTNEYRMTHQAAGCPVACLCVRPELQRGTTWHAGDPCDRPPRLGACCTDGHAVVKDAVTEAECFLSWCRGVLP